MRIFACALALLILVAQGANAKEIQVTMKGMKYSPDKIVAKRGDVLVLVNDDTVAHDAFVSTFGFGVNPGGLKPGETKRIALMKRGHFVVECAFHDTMKINVTVQ
ncbi:MAG TPA: cupredoxin domain-containing protein [Stellaceae bacterium]|nr:cupredoxin domain-containing protein [Stellaceae bacterium]